MNNAYSTFYFMSYISFTSEMEEKKDTVLTLTLPCVDSL